MKKIAMACMVVLIAQVSYAQGDLSGRWSCNDGGTYYLRQTGTVLLWYGESAHAQPVWSNVFSGQIRQGRIKGRWSDVPKGRTAGSGELELAIEKDGDHLRAVNKSGGFGGSRWVRLATGTTDRQPLTLTPLKPSKNEDCVRFNPASVSVIQVDGRWKIVDRDHWLFDFGSNRAAADQALNIIHHYRLDRSCFIGRPQPSFSYLLAKGGSPSGKMAGEDCIAFDPQRATLSKINGRWKIVSGRQWLFDFGKKENEARKALAAIKRHGFTRSCYVGRPKPDFTYLRR